MASPENTDAPMAVGAPVSSERATETARANCSAIDAPICGAAEALPTLRLQFSAATRFEWSFDAERFFEADIVDVWEAVQLRRSRGECALVRALDAQPVWGSPDDWPHWSKGLGLTEDLLPVVSNPNAVISPYSTMTALGKTPSRYNGSGQVCGIERWTEFRATAGDILDWMEHPDYGISLQTRHVRAIDVDIEHAEQSAAVRKLITQRCGPLPLRFRRNSHKFLVLLRVDTDEDLRKRIIRTEHGIIEFLANGQQCVVAGTHSSGVRYEWEPFTHIPTVALDRVFEA